MEVNQLVAHYKANYERKVFMTRLSHAMQNAYLWRFERFGYEIA